MPDGPMPDGVPPEAPPEAPLGPAREVLTVSDLTRLVKEALEGALGTVWLTGEVSNLRRAPSGHVYLTLKDAAAQVRAVIWGSTARYLRQLPADGDQVLCKGRITVYEPRGEYQVVLDYVEPAGLGALYRRFEETRARLAAEGLFDAGRKRPLPALARRVAVVTSPTGAAVRDVLNVLGRRAPGLEVLVVPALVQGRDAPRQVIAGLAAVAALQAAGDALDAVLVVRGGGSLEDLAAFNDEALARAVAACPVPVVSGVGHETDTTICDLAADLRAATPSAAAELVSAAWVAWRERLEAVEGRLGKAVRGRLAARRLEVERARALLVDPAERLRRLIQRVDDLRLTLGRLTDRRLAAARHGLDTASVRLAGASPAARLAPWRERTGSLAVRAERAARVRLERSVARLAGASGRLEGLSPMGVLARGFAVAVKDGRVLRKAADAAVGDRVTVRLHEGTLHTRVEDASP
jgi:exodeoxyribonuclease VII large subunit